jgi:hypothetical protein
VQGLRPPALDNARLIEQPSAKQFMPEPQPIGVENVALAVLGNLPDVAVAVVFFGTSHSGAAHIAFGRLMMNSRRSFNDLTRSE